MSRGPRGGPSWAAPAGQGALRLRLRRRAMVLLMTDLGDSLLAEHFLDHVDMIARFGPAAVQPDPTNFNVPGPELRYARREGPLRLLVLGGSQGALALNRTVPAALAQLPEAVRPIVRHQCGATTIDRARAAYEAAGLDAELLPYLKRHSVGDTIVLPAAAYVEMALAASRAWPAACLPWARAVAS